MRPLAAAPVLVVLLLGACEKGGADAAVEQTSAAPSTSAVASTPAGSVPGAGSGSPKTDPCELLTKGIAEGALGVAVGAPTTTTLPGNETCSYKPADGRPNVFVLLTTYAASGKAALATATATFPDAKSVPDLGDAALVSRRGRAIGVSVGDLLFGMSLLRPDGLSEAPEVSEAQLITLARAVVRSR